MLGFTAMLFRGVPGWLPAMIIAQNTLIVAGTVFIYVGVQKFFDRKINLSLLLIVVSLFLAGLLYFLFFENDIRNRSATINAALTTISLITALSLLFNPIPAIRFSARFNGIVFLAHAAVFLYRTVMILLGASVENVFEASLFNILPYLDAILVGLLWTFGFILMLNQRLTADISEARADMQQIFNTSPDAAIITRLNDGLIVDCNEGYCRITGYSRAEMEGKTTPAIQIWKDINDRKNMVSILQTKGFCENYEAEFLCKNGTVITGLMSARVISLKGVPHIISITRDITAVKKAERDKAAL